MYEELCNLRAGQLYIVEVENLVNGKLLTAMAPRFTSKFLRRAKFAVNFKSHFCFLYCMTFDSLLLSCTTVRVIQDW